MKQTMMILAFRCNRLQEEGMKTYNMLWGNAEKIRDFFIFMYPQSRKNSNARPEIQRLHRGV